MSDEWRAKLILLVFKLPDGTGVQGLVYIEIALVHEDSILKNLGIQIK